MDVVTRAQISIDIARSRALTSAAKALRSASRERRLELRKTLQRSTALGFIIRDNFKKIREAA